MTRTKTLQKKYSKKNNNISRRTLNRLGIFFKKLAGKELSI